MVEWLIVTAWRYPEMFGSLMEKPWMQDEISREELIVVEHLYVTAREEVAFAELMLKKTWMQDGITRDEATVIDRFASIASAEEKSLQGRVIEKAMEILYMPFLDTVESPDALAVDSLECFEDEGSAEFLKLMSHPRLRDGIDDEEAKIVVLLGETNEHQPELVPVPARRDQGFQEERTIILPHSGEVLLAIIRFHDHTGPNMDYLEYAVRHHEGFMGEPLPTNYVAWYFVDYTSAGWNAGTHIASNPRRDPSLGEYWRAPRHASHETAHYYWRGSPAWIDEGAADMLVIFSENSRVGRPLVPNRDQCLSFNTIAKLDAADTRPGDYGFDCSYTLGQRLFLDLYQVVGAEAFQQAFRRLYLKRLDDVDLGDSCEVGDLGICHVEAAFKVGASKDVVAKVAVVVGHWYDGRTASHEGDRAELVSLYRATGGRNWQDGTNWLSDTPIGEWFGVSTDAAGRVISLNLADNGLSGELPAGLGNLSNLQELLLSDNRLRGEIPPELGNLSNLTLLELDDNALRGEIPPELGNLSNLTLLELDDNALRGEIPPELGNLSNLTLLELHNNELWGDIPSSMGNLSALRWSWMLDGNRFSGCVPVGLMDVPVNDVADGRLPSC